LASAAFNRNPVGSGPFRFVEWRANDRLVLERNPDFPAGLGGPPLLDRVVIRVVPEATTLQTELLTGGVHIAIPIEPEQAEQVQESGQAELHVNPGRTFYYIGWNNARAPFTDARVRRAMTMAINRAEIVDGLLYGYGQTAIGPVPPWHPQAPELDPLPYDPDAAGRLLDEAGWSDRNGDGIRENAAGQPLRFTLLTSDRLLNRNIGAVVQAQLRRAGVDAEIRAIEFQTLLGAHRSRDFDAVLSAWVLDNFQLASTPMALFHSQWVPVAGSSNRSSFANPRADSLIEAGAAATDADDGRRIWREFTELLQTEQPFTFLFWFPELSGVSTRVHGVVQDPRGVFVTMKEWSL
ncbi:MAG TPA: ABC transporter substrate-binding protein, partial [Longimicrobiales bacterium]|nr:ABC transporter substrate-binding protein [Longimicrobiales bacterium]